MIPKLPDCRPFLQKWPFSLLLIITLSITGCGHSEAAPNEIPMGKMMEAINHYGKGHSQESVPAVTPQPAQPPPDGEPPEIAFAPHMKSLLVQENFAELERIASKARGEKIRHSGGVWQIFDFYDAVAEPIGSPVVGADWDYTISLIQKWNTSYPESATARLALADAYYGRGWFARGQGYSNTVSGDAWKNFYRDVTRSKSTLLEAAQLKDRDPFWYHQMLRIASSEGWDESQRRELLEEAAVFEPNYLSYYREYGNSLLPKWGGAESETQAFADEMLKRLSEPQASMAYFEIASLAACQCETDRDSLLGLSWPTTRQGYANIVRLYGTNNLKANRFAYMAFIANDKAAAHDAFVEIGDQWNNAVWRNQLNFETARDWSVRP
jgi:hypothetical protein